MITVQDILDFLQTVAPAELKMEWDNVGLLCGRKDKQVKTILVALDPFAHVCEEAVEKGADLLLTHHPLIFESLSNITDETTDEEILATKHGWEVRFAKTAARHRAALIAKYGEERGRKIRYAEAFQICEYGEQPDEEFLNKAFYL